LSRPIIARLRRESHRGSDGITVRGSHQRLLQQNRHKADMPIAPRNVRFGGYSGHGAGIAECRLMTDAVEKRFCSSEQARLIQDQASMRNVDSKIRSPGFDCCVFLFYSLSAATFSTASTQSGHWRPPSPPAKRLQIRPLTS
jgi:hypothetical protein